MVQRVGRVVAAMLACASVAFAENAERGQRSAEEEVLPKLNLACGTTFTVKYDLASLKANNKDIGWDQTSGSLECDEPLRILWTLCQTPAGKALVRKAELREVQCRGITGGEGRLTVKNGVILVERANDEGDAYLRARVQFEKALGTKVTMAVANPYEDQAWRELRQAPAPVTSTTDYCLVDGKKEQFDAWAGDKHRGDGTVKCWKAGALVIDLTVRNRRKSGLDRTEGDDWFRSEHFTDGKRDGLSEQTKKGVVVRQELFKAGERVWSKEYTDAGKLKDYSLRLPGGLVSLRLLDDGRVTGLSCSPEVKGDEVLGPWCGFSGEKTVTLYDGTNKVSAVRTFRDGRLVREEPGDSHYASRRAVSYDPQGKKQGEERVTREDGTLERTLTWKAGVQDGAEQVYAKDGKKVVERAVWKDGEQVERTESFLNGNPKRRERFDGEKSLERTSWYDLGQMESQGRFVRCDNRYGDRWCEDGLQQRWHENGKRAEESTWKAGKQDGPAKRWYQNGERASEEQWRGGSLVSRKEWDDKGKVTADDEFEEDGSRKVKR